MFQWVQNYLMLHILLAPLIFIFFHVLFAACLIPCSPMAVIAGLIWGKGLGLAISIVAAFLSSCFTFALSRFFLKRKIYHFLSKRYSKIDIFLEQTKIHGWKFVASIQLNPGAPGSTLGYLFGLSNIPFSIYAFYLFIFMLPLQLLLVVFGDSIAKTTNSSTIPWLYIGIISSIILAYLLYKIGSKSTRRGLLDE